MYGHNDPSWKVSALWREVRSTREVEAVCPLDPVASDSYQSDPGCRFLNLDI